VKAIIVAAGLSSRLQPLTDTTPKGLLDVGGRTILDRSVSNFENAGIDDIVVVVGWERNQIQDHLGDRVRYVFNPFFETTNNMASLWFSLQADEIEPMIYVHGDVVFTPDTLSQLIEFDPASEAVLVVDAESIDEEAMKVRVENGRFIESHKQIPLDEAAGEWIGFARFSIAAATSIKSQIEKLLAQEMFQVYDTAAFNELAKSELEFQILDTNGAPWCEIDFKEDLETARQLFPPESNG